MNPDLVPGSCSFLDPVTGWVCAGPLPCPRHALPASAGDLLSRYVKVESADSFGGYLVRLRVEQQSFCVGSPDFESREHAEWFATMLARALAKMVALEVNRLSSFSPFGHPWSAPECKYVPPGSDSE